MHTVSPGRGNAAFVTLVLVLGLFSLLFQLTGCQQQSRPGGTATQLAFGSQPRTTLAGGNISPSVTVRVLDANGKLVSTATTAVTLALENNPGGGTLSGTLTVNAVKGIATFPVLSISHAGTGYTLRATAGSLTPAVSTSFNITAGLPTRLGFITQPSNTAVGAVITPAVRVAVQDTAGNTITTGTYDIRIVFILNPTGTPLLGTLTRTTVDGIATFNDLSADKIGNGYKLHASCTGLTSAKSTLFNITAGSPAQLAFDVQPTNAVAGTAITPAVTVRVLDVAGNPVTTATTAVTLAIGDNPGDGTLAGTLTQNAVGGIATFNNLSIGKAGTGYTLCATATGLTAATSQTFDIAAAAPAQLAFEMQPTDTPVGETISPAVTVRVQDAFGNAVTNATNAITLFLAESLGGAALYGTTTRNAVGGTASFDYLCVDKMGEGYTLRATATGLTAATSAPFNITIGRPALMAFVTQPSTTQAGAVITPAVTVQVQDAMGNPITNTAISVTLEIDTNPGDGTLSGTVTKDTVAGLATFDNLSINKAGTGYTLRTTGTGLTETTSASFNITVGTPAGLAFSVQPANTVAGSTITPAVTVQVVDAQGNPVPTATNSITVAIQNNPVGGQLSGSATKNAVGGVATFNNLSINKAGNGYTLRAIASGLPVAASAPFNILPAPPTRLAFGVQPGNTAAGDAITPAVTVYVQDALGNTVAGASNAVTLAIGTNPGGDSLSGTVTRNAVNGVATFTNLSINKAAGGYTLTAAADGLTGATSATFTISAGAPAQLAFGVQPTNTPPNEIISPAVTVRVLDQLGNTVPSATNAISLALDANPADGTLAGTLTKNAVGGTATFGDLSIDQEGSGYTLLASAAGVTSATSTGFNIAPLPPSGILGQFQQRLQALQVPPVTTLAETIATYNFAHPDMVFHYGWHYYDLAFSEEFIARSGSFRNWWYAYPEAGKPITPDIAVFSVRSWEEDGVAVADMIQYSRQYGWQVLLIASSAGMPQGLDYDYFIDNGASSGSMDETAVNMLVNITLYRFFQCEFVAACTRMMGVYPGLYMSVELPGGNEFDLSLDPPTAMYPTDEVLPAGTLSEAYRDRLEWLIGQLAGSTIQTEINNSADIVAARFAMGQKVGLATSCHAVPFEINHAMHCSYVPILAYYSEQFQQMDPGELVVYIGYTGMSDWMNRAYEQYILDAGLDYIASYSPDLNPDRNAHNALEIIDQSWLLGDSEVPLPFLPNRMAPMSTLNALLVMRMLDEAVKLRVDTPQTPESRTFTSQAEFDDCTRDRGIDTTTMPGSVMLAPVDYILDDVGNKITEASGSAYQGKKIFVIDEPQATGATVYIFRGAAAATFNGTPLAFAPVPGNRNWYAAAIAPELLQQGSNELVMTSGCQVPVDAENDAGRSFVSVDDGASWQAAPGEFLAHLCLNRYQSQGTITSEVLDLANIDNQAIICPDVTVKTIALQPEYTTHAGIDAVRFEVRAGDTPRPDGSWTAWRPSFVTPGRYMQWRATLSTTDHQYSPELMGVIVKYIMDTTPATDLTVNTFENQRIERSSFPFTYQTASGKLAGLRTAYNLDDVVAAGATELEKFTLLQQWVRKQWPHNEDGCFRPWDAVDILSAPPGEHGMCTHFAAVFTQCALALGFNARMTLLQHHAVSEIWSNEYQKWVLIDEEAVQPEGWDRYGTAQYWRDGAPLNAREIHDAWANDDTLGITQRLYMSDDGGNTFQTYDRTYPALDYAGNFRVFMHPKRNNHLDEREPWEEAQGWDYYHSNDYYIWSDGAVPDYSEFSSFSTREADNYWTLNQAQVTLTATADPGQLAVNVMTETPNFKEFRYRLNGGEWQTLSAGNCGGITEVADYTWALAPGANTLEIMPRNLFDRDGIITTITVTRAL